MLSEILNYVANIAPVMIASYDAGFNHFFNGDAARDYLESYLVTKDKA